VNFISGDKPGLVWFFHRHKYLNEGMGFQYLLFQKRIINTALVAGNYDDGTDKFYSCLGLFFNDPGIKTWP